MAEDPLTHYIRATERMRLRAEAAEARLAAVEALCDAWEAEPPHGPMWHAVPRQYAAKVRAAAQGEGDRPAEPWPACRDHHEVQHRDGKPPWCKKCGWNRGRPPVPPRQVSDRPWYRDNPMGYTPRGEGARPAAPCRHDGSNGTCAECRLTHLHSGEGDRG